MLILKSRNFRLFQSAKRVTRHFVLLDRDKAPSLTRQIISFPMTHRVIGIRTVGRDNRVMLEGVSQSQYLTTNHGRGCGALFSEDTNLIQLHPNI